MRVCITLLKIENVLGSLKYSLLKLNFLPSLKFLIKDKSIPYFIYFKFEKYMPIKAIEIIAIK